MNDATCEHDVIIVGAGRCGRRWAEQLTSSGRSVMLLDATAAGPGRASHRGRSLDWTSEAQPGLNGRRLQMGAAADAWNNGPGDGAGAEADAAWQAVCLQAAREVGLTFQAVGGADWPAAQSRAPGPAPGASATCLQARALRLLFEGRRAAGLEVQRRGRVEVLKARQDVWLCAGALGSALLLQASGVGDGAAVQKAGIRYKHHLPAVGHGLCQPLGVVLDQPAQRTGVFAGSAWAAWHAELQQRWTSDDTGLAAVHWYLPPAAEDPRGPGMRMGLQLVLARRWGVALRLSLVLERPSSRGRVQILGPDALGPAHIDPNCLSAPDDLDRLVHACRQAQRLMQAPSLASRLQGAAADELPLGANGMLIREFIRDHARAIGPARGTCRAGPDDEAVVDSEGRVRGLDGLRVDGSASVAR